MSNSFIVIAILVLFSACTKSPKDTETGGEKLTSSVAAYWAKDTYSGVWVLYQDSKDLGVHRGALKSNDIAYSDIIIIKEEGEDWYSITGVEDVGNMPSISSTHTMSLVYKDAPRQNIIIEGSDTLIHDAFHILRFSEHDSPSSFDLEVMVKSAPFKWSNVGRYVRIPVDVTTPSDYLGEDYLERHWRKRGDR